LYTERKKTTKERGGIAIGTVSAGVGGRKGREARIERKMEKERKMKTTGEEEISRYKKGDFVEVKERETLLCSKE
jgi:hypothetical protein